MISIDEKSTIKTIEIYLSEYRSIFKKRSFHIFILLVTDILSIQEVRSIKFIYDNFISKKKLFSVSSMGSGQPPKKG